MNEIVSFYWKEISLCLKCINFISVLTKNKKRIQKFKETGDSRYIYQNELDKDCFQHDLAYGDFKDLTRRTDKISF